MRTTTTSASRQGKSATCNPISQPDLAAALVDTISDPSKKDALWNLGGPDEGLSMRQQGEMLADVLDKEEAKLLGVPIGIFDAIIGLLQAPRRVRAACLGSAPHAHRVRW